MAASHPFSKFSVASGGHPFEILMRKGVGEGNEGKVVLNSSLMRSIRPDDRITITGLDAWFDVINEDNIWLQLTIDSGSVTEANIQSWGQGDSWDAFPSPIKFVGGTQVAAMIQIAYTHTDPNSSANPPLLYQCVTKNLILRNICGGGRAAIFAYEHSAPYIAAVT